MNKTPLTLVALAALPLALCGCPTTYGRFAATTERAYAVSYNTDTKSGSLSVTLRPAITPGTPLAAPVAMDDATIAKIIRLMELSAQKQVATPMENTDAKAVAGKEAQ